MNLKIVCWFFGLLIKGTATQPQRCDKGRAVVSEGFLGETEVLPWLGLLKVYLREDTSSAYTVALTGIVYVKESYAIANADDIVKIPKRVFQEDSHAMFLPRPRSPWYCRLRDYMTHPEYEAQTLSSIALIELDPGKEQFPMKPICWPSYAFNASNHLYGMGYTDEGELLEKFITNLEYIDRGFCKEFYEKSELTSLTPTHYHCAHAQNRADTCVWDNGMVLASNATGHWILLGLGLFGPGCASPARFIDLLTYIPWIQSSTDLNEDDSYRKSAFDYGFRYREEYPSGEPAEIPAHELLGRRYDLPEGMHGFGHYQVQQRLDVETMFHIERINGAEIVIHKYSKTGQYGNCSEPFLRLVYMDSLRVTSLGSGNQYIGRRPRLGTVQYRLSLYDLHVINYTCVIIRAHSGVGSNAYLHYSTSLAGGDLFQETPPDILRVYPYHLRQKLIQVRPGVLEDEITRHNARSLDLYLKYRYVNRGRLDITIKGPPLPPTTPPTTTRTPRPG